MANRLHVPGNRAQDVTITDMAPKNVDDLSHERHCSILAQYLMGQREPTLLRLDQSAPLIDQLVNLTPHGIIRHALGEQVLHVC
jgi:hypothetical protein